MVCTGFSYGKRKTKMADWSTSNIPPPGHDDLGPFVYELWQEARREKERLGLYARWAFNHRIYRGTHWITNTFGRDDKYKMVVNLVFANIERTVSGLTSEDPVAEIHSSDGILDEIDALFSQKIKDWWSDTEQAMLLASSTRGMEIYGPTIEKYVPNLKKNALDVVLIDPWAFDPAPGNYQSIQDMPYIAFSDAIPMHVVEKKFGVEAGSVTADDVYSALGEDRESNIPIPSSMGASTAINVAGHYVMTGAPQRGGKDFRGARALVIEMWFKDYTTTKVQKVAGTDPETGEEIVEEVDEPKYPGNIRKITVTNRGALVLDDSPNPNVNPAMDPEQAKKTYGYSNFPCSMAVSYKDTAFIWGFSAAEQVGDLQLKIDELLSRIKAYIDLCCMPPLVIPKDAGIVVKGPGGDLKVNNRPGLILQPENTQVSKGIRYVQVPSLPQDFFKALDLYLMFFDRIFAIQDINRGEKPGEVRSGSGIQLLQQRNDSVMAHKGKSMDYLVRERGRWAISYYQNFGWREETVTVNDEAKTFRGIDFAGRSFQYVVESGSTLIKSDSQIQQDAMALFQAGAIDTQTLLQRINFPGWKSIISRLSGSKVDIALQTLVDAGVPEEIVQQLKPMIQAREADSNKQQADMPAGVKGSSNPARPADQNLMR